MTATSSIASYRNVWILKRLSASYPKLLRSQTGALIKMITENPHSFAAATRGVMSSVKHWIRVDRT
jgi:hypothetical protein